MIVERFLTISFHLGLAGLEISHLLSLGVLFNVL